MNACRFLAGLALACAAGARNGGRPAGRTFALLGHAACVPAAFQRKGLT